ncbi:hypothetical protein NHJ13051_009738, partial [Beauveria bassiana]
MLPDIPKPCPSSFTQHISSINVHSTNYAISANKDIVDRNVFRRIT